MKNLLDTTTTTNPTITNIKTNNNTSGNLNSSFNIFIKIDNKDPPTEITNPISVSLDNTFLDIIKLIGDESGKKFLQL